MPEKKEKRDGRRQGGVAGPAARSEWSGEGNNRTREDKKENKNVQIRG